MYLCFCLFLILDFFCVVKLRDWLTNEEKATDIVNTRFSMEWVSFEFTKNKEIFNDLLGDLN